MAIVRRKLAMTCVAGSATGTMSAGSVNGSLLRVTIYTTANGEDFDISITDAESRTVYAMTGVDYDASTLKLDGVTYTSLAVDSGLIGALLFTNTTGAVSVYEGRGVPFRGPLTIALANGGTMSVIVVAQIEV